MLDQTPLKNSSAKTILAAALVFCLGTGGIVDPLQAADRTVLGEFWSQDN